MKKASTHSQVLFENIGDNLTCAVRNPHRPDDMAFGFRDSTIQLWDIKLSRETKKPKWTAKNLPNDELDLPIPVWDTDLAYLSRTNAYSLVACSAYCDVREYDTRGPRKPVTATKVFSREIGTKDIFQKSEMFLSKIF